VSFDNGAALKEQSTPQNEALNWLANNTNLNSYSNATKIQRYALATLFYSTNGTSWYQNLGWLSHFDECDWYTYAGEGSSCDENRTVKDLNLSENNLVGTIPNELALLSNLSWLDLSVNSLTGTIPSQLGLLSNLAELDLSGNGLTGTIPSQIAMMSNLTWLDLSVNSLTGTIPSQIAFDVQFVFLGSLQQ